MVVFLPGSLLHPKSDWAPDGCQSSPQGLPPLRCTSPNETKYQGMVILCSVYKRLNREVPLPLSATAPDFHIPVTFCRLHYETVLEPFRFFLFKVGARPPFGERRFHSLTPPP